MGKFQIIVLLFCVVNGFLAQEDFSEDFSKNNVRQPDCNNVGNIFYEEDVSDEATKEPRRASVIDILAEDDDPYQIDAGIETVETNDDDYLIDLTGKKKVFLYSLLLPPDHPVEKKVIACKEKYGLDEKMFLMAKLRLKAIRVIPVTRRMACFMACVYGELGAIRPDGNMIDLTPAEEEHFAWNQGLRDACFETVGGDPCEFMACLHELKIDDDKTRPQITDL